ncbi:MAG: amino acid adenylation domain-containing protein [Candidatus Xenobia bacterium]
MLESVLSLQATSPLSFTQEMVWWLQQLTPSLTAYNVPLARRVRGPLDFGRLQAALRTVVARHEILRTVYRDGVQMVAFDSGLELEQHSARDEAEGLAVLGQQVNRPFDVERERPLRASLVRLAPDHHLLMFVATHLAWDGASFGPFLAELSATYRGEVLPPLPCQYADYARWQRAQPHEALLAWWKQRLAGAPELLELPTDRARPALQSFRGGVVRRPFPAGLSRALTAVARESRATQFHLLLAAFHVLLWRYSGQDDLVVGTPVANRPPEWECHIGFFANTMLCRAQLEAKQSFRSLLEAVRMSVQEGLAHQELPFGTLVAALAPQRSLSFNPLFQAMLAFDAGPSADLEIADAVVTPLVLDRQGSAFDLTVTVSRDDLCLEFASDLFEAATASRLLQHYETLLTAIVEAPDAPLEGLRLEPRRSVSHGVSVPPPMLLHEVVAPTARVQEMDCADLMRRANQVARWLHRRGMGAEAIVGVSIPRSTDAIVALLGILKAGAAWLPLDPAWPQARRQMMVEDSGATMVLTDLHEAEAESDAPLDLSISPAQAAYVIYTSGSTGRPRGVVVEHASAAWYARTIAEHYQIAPSDRVLQFSSLSFDASVEEIFGTLAGGATLVLRDEDMLGTPEHFMRRCTELGITVLSITTAWWHEIADHPQVPPGLRLLAIGGERARPDLVAAWQARFGHRVRFLNTYGPTETTVAATTWECSKARPGMRETPIGTPLPGVQVCVLDSTGQPVPRGVPGELYVGGCGLARGYLNERFNGFYRTGDRVRELEDGTLEFCGRVDDQIKVRGFRVQPCEVEAALTSHPEVRHAVVTAQEGRLIAWIVTHAPVTRESLLAHARKLLPVYMVPSIFHQLEHLPLTPGGKVDRRQLLRRVEQPLIEERAPATPSEALMAALWADVLGTVQVGRDQSFFDLGGHSLLGTRLLSQIARAFGVTLPLRVLFEHPTVAALTAEVASRCGAPAPPALQHVPHPGTAPASFFQQRMWVLQQMEGACPHYNIPWVLRLRGRLDVDALQRVLGQLVARHEALRTCLELDTDGNVLQRIAPAEPVWLPLDALSEAQAMQRISEEEQAGFDLRRGPLMRCRLLRLGTDDHVLVIVLHHAVCDGWSLRVLSQELEALYAGRELSPPALQYADFARAQRVLHLDWWKEQLRGLPPAALLCADRRRPAQLSFRGGRVRRALDAQAVRARARQQAVTPFMLLLAAFKAVLCRFGGSRDLVVGTPLAARSGAELEAIVGPCLNMLVLRTACDPEQPFADLVAAVRHTVLEAVAHADLPFEMLVEALAPRRSLSQHPLFQVAFVYDDWLRETPHLPGLEVEPVSIDSPTSKFDLTLIVCDRSDGVHCEMEYALDLFETRTVESLLDSFVALLDAEPGDAVSCIKLPPFQPAAAASAGCDQTVVDRFGQQVARHPQARAVGDLTYDALNRRANLLAHGIPPGAHVGILMERSVEAIVAMLAVLKAGAVYVPIDSAWPEERRRLVLEDSGVSVVLTRSDVPQEEAETAPPRQLEPDAPAYVMYTSGSTGQPKGVVVPHRGIVRLVCGADYAAMGPDETWLQLAPLAFDASTLEIWAPLLNGGRLVLMPPGPASPAAIAAEIVRQSVTSLWLTAGLFHLMVDNCLEGLRPLRQLLAGGDVLSPEHVRRVHQALPGVRLINGYGPTENTTFTCCHTVTDGDVDRISIPVGTPIAGTEVWILDARGEPVPQGAVGELYTGGEGLALGYWNRPELTAERFVTWRGRRVYRTGDLARWNADGAVEFLGRADRQIKLLGHRIEPGEIEARLHAHSAVQQAVAGVRRAVNGEKMLVAWVVGSDPMPDLRAWLKQSLPEPMVPAQVVALPALPLSPNGKVDVEALPLPAAGAVAAFEAPRDWLEREVAQVWEQVLGHPGVGRQDNFFDLGGHSLAAGRVVARLEHTLSRPVSLQALFMAQTLAGFCDALRQEGRSWRPIVELSAGPQPPIFFVHSLGGDHGGGFFYYRQLAECLAPWCGSYGICAPLEPFEEVETMAASYLREVRRLQPHGPYRLAGFCFGGKVAYEMARQLREQGESVDLLALFEAYAPGYPRRTLLEQIRAAFRRLSSLRLREAPQLLYRCLSRRIRQPSLGEVMDVSQYPAEYRQAAEAHWKANCRYFPGPCDVAAVTYRTPEHRDTGWEALARRGVHHVVLQARHVEILEAPAVHRIAEDLVGRISCRP